MPAESADIGFCIFKLFGCTDRGNGAFLRQYSLSEQSLNKTDEVESFKVFRVKSVIMDQNAVFRALRRISYEIIEKNRGCDGLCLVGVCRRGVPLASMIAENIKAVEGIDAPSASLRYNHV